MAFLVAVVYLMLFSPFFNIKVVEVIGVYTLDPGKVEATANFTFDENLFLQDNIKKEKALLKAYPVIKKVKIRQSLPDKIIIEITEKIPEIVVLAPPNFLLVDNRGEIIDIVGKLNQVSAPILTGVDFSTDSIKGQILVKDTLRIALAFLSQVPENKMYLIREITVGPDGLAIYPTGSYKVVVGENKNVVKKLNTLEALMRESSILSNTIDYIDISNPEKIIKKTKEGIS